MKVIPFLTAFGLFMISVARGEDVQLEIKPGYHVVLYDGTIISGSEMEQTDFRPTAKS